MPNAEAEYDKLKGLLQALGRYSGGEDRLLHDAEMALKGNIGNVDALNNLEGNLRNTRLRVLSELTGIIKTFG